MALKRKVENGFDLKQVRTRAEHRMVGLLPENSALSVPRRRRVAASASSFSSLSLEKQDGKSWPELQQYTQQDIDQFLNDPECCDNAGLVGLMAASLNRPVLFIKQVVDKIQDKIIRQDFLSSAINELMTAISNQPSTPLTHAMALYACISFLRDAPTDISLANNIYMHDLRHALEHVNKKLAAKENKENKAQVAAAREALTLVLEEEKNHDGYVVRLSTLFAAAHQLSLDHVDVDLNLLSLPMFSIAKNLEPQAAVRKITGIVDVLCSELKKNGYPVDSRLENDLKSFSTHVREQVSRQKNSPLTCTQLVHIFWPLVRCIFRTLNDCDQSVFSLPIVSQLVSSFLTNLANAPMHAVVF